MGTGLDLKALHRESRFKKSSMDLHRSPYTEFCQYFGGDLTLLSGVY
ncbi:MAG: hypothetical protein L3J82_10185 [Planctomycetes bacterium]|nr:hypothetical protein [Planctomycetota bacterium]